jgi:hypothetical protein
MAETSKTNTTSPTEAKKQTKIPSSRRKKKGFSKKNNIETIAKQNHCDNKVRSTLGDKDIFPFLKPENEIKIDAYSRHFKEDLHWEGPIQENLNLVGGFPRRKSHGSEHLWIPKLNSEDNSSSQQNTTDKY